MFRLSGETFFIINRPQLIIETHEINFRYQSDISKGSHDLQANEMPSSYINIVAYVKLISQSSARNASRI